MDLSIVIPMYNASEFIVRLLDSIYKQSSYNINFEVIIIDDTSTDLSIDAVNNYIELNSISNIKLIKQEVNGGTAEARNRGIECATGKWIQFVDSDDWVQNNYFELIAPRLKDENVDCYVYGAKKYWADSITTNTPIGDIDKRMIGYKNIVVNKIYKSELIGQFDINYRFEDVIWIINTMNSSDIKCSILNGLYYHINRTNENSKMANFNSNEWYKMAKAIVSKSKSLDALTRAYVLETFTGTIFAKDIKLSLRLTICIENLVRNIKYLRIVLKNGIRNNDKYEKKESHH